MDHQVISNFKGEVTSDTETSRNLNLISSIDLQDHEFGLEEIVAGM